MEPPPRMHLSVKSLQGRFTSCTIQRGGGKTQTKRDRYREECKGKADTKGRLGQGYCKLILLVAKTASDNLNALGNN